MVEALQAQDVFRHAPGSQRHVKLAVLGEHRRENSRVPPAAGNQFQHAHVVFEAEEIQRPERQTVGVAGNVGLRPAFGGYGCFYFVIDRAGQHDGASG